MRGSALNQAVLTSEPLLIAVLTRSLRIPWRGSMPSGPWPGSRPIRVPAGPRRLVGDPHPACASTRSAWPRIARRVARPTDALIGLADDPAIRVRLQAALALGERCPRGSGRPGGPGTDRRPGRGRSLDAAGDPQRAGGVVSGLHRAVRSDRRLRRAAPNCCRRPPRSSGPAAMSLEMATLLGTIADWIRGEATDAMTLLAGLADGLERPGKPLHALVASRPGRSEGTARTALAALAGRIDDGRLRAGPVPERLMALDVLARGRPDLAEGIIPGLLAADQPREVQVAAARAIARVGRTSLADKALDRWESLALATRRELLSALAGSPALAEPLIRALERQVDRAARARCRDPRGPPAPGRSRLAGPRRGRAGEVRAAAALGRARPLSGRAQAGRRPDRGGAVFARNCQTCHQHQGQGHRVGPELSGIAGRAPMRSSPTSSTPTRMSSPTTSSSPPPPAAARSTPGCSPRRPPPP